MTCVEVRRPRCEEQERPGQILRLAQPPLRDPGDDSLAHPDRLGRLGEHPLGEGRAKHGRPNRVDGDSRRAQFAGQRFGDSVDRRLRGAIGGIACGMAEQPARRGDEDYLAAAALRLHPPRRGARQKPGLRHVGVHDFGERRRRHLLDHPYPVDARRHDQNVEAAMGLHGFLHHSVHRRFGIGARVHRGDRGPKVPALARDGLERVRITGGQRKAAPGLGQGPRGDRPESARRAGDQRRASADVERVPRVSYRAVLMGDHDRHLAGVKSRFRMPHAKYQAGVVSRMVKPD